MAALNIAFKFTVNIEIFFSYSQLVEYYNDYDSNHRLQTVITILEIYAVVKPTIIFGKNWVKDGQIILQAWYNSNAKCNSQIEMFTDPIIAAISKISAMNLSYLKRCVNYCFSLLGQAMRACLFYTWPNFMTNCKTNSIQLCTQ